MIYIYTDVFKVWSWQWTHKCNRPVIYVVDGTEAAHVFGGSGAHWTHVKRMIHYCWTFLETRPRSRRNSRSHLTTRMGNLPSPGFHSPSVMLKLSLRCIMRERSSSDDLSSHSDTAWFDLSLWWREGHHIVGAHTCTAQFVQFYSMKLQKNAEGKRMKSQNDVISLCD